MCVCVCVCVAGGYADLPRGWCHIQPDSGVNGRTEKMNTAIAKRRNMSVLCCGCLQSQEKGLPNPGPSLLAETREAKRGTSRHLTAVPFEESDAEIKQHASNTFCQFWVRYLAHVWKPNLSELYVALYVFVFVHEETKTRVLST